MLHHCLQDFVGIPTTIWATTSLTFIPNWTTLVRTVWTLISTGTRSSIDCWLRHRVEIGMKTITGTGKGIVRTTVTVTEIVATVIGTVIVIEIETETDTEGITSETGRRIAENIITIRLIVNETEAETEITEVDIGMATRKIAMINTAKVHTKRIETMTDWISLTATPKANPHSDLASTSSPTVILQPQTMPIHHTITIHQLRHYQALLRKSTRSGILFPGKRPMQLLNLHRLHFLVTTMALRTGTMTQTIRRHRLLHRHFPSHPTNHANTKTRRKSKKTTRQPSIWTPESP